MVISQITWAIGVISFQTGLDECILAAHHSVVLLEEDGVVDGGVADSKGPLHHDGLGALPDPGQTF